MKKSFLFLVVVLVAAGLVILISKNKPNSTSKVVPATPIPSINTSQGKSYSLTEIASHKNADNCWLAIEGKVYDVTNFIASGKHQGGLAILDGCGKDATLLFNTRPMGSGTPHSQKALAMLAQFYIGELIK